MNRTSLRLGLLVLILRASVESAALLDTNGTDSGSNTVTTKAVILESVTYAPGSVMSRDSSESDSSGVLSRPVLVNDGNLKKKPGYHNEALSSPNHLQHQQTPCEAGHPCRVDEWCSPSRSVCRSCEDVNRWCNDSALIRDSYPTCEHYCFKSQLKQREEACEVQIETIKQQLHATELAFGNFTEKTQRDKEAWAREKSQLHQRCRIQESSTKGNTNIIAVLACALAASLIWALIVTVLLYRQHLRSEGHHGIGAQDPEALPRSTEQVNAPLLPIEEMKIPVQDRTKDSGQYCGNNGHPGPRVPGDAAVVPI